MVQIIGRDLASVQKIEISPGVERFDFTWLGSARRVSSRTTEVRLHTNRSPRKKGHWGRRDR